MLNSSMHAERDKNDAKKLHNFLFKSSANRDRTIGNIVASLEMPNCLPRIELFCFVNTRNANSIDFKTS